MHITYVSTDTAYVKGGKHMQFRSNLNGAIRFNSPLSKQSELREGK